MHRRHFVTAGVASVLLLGLAVLGPAPASATNMWQQQAILLIHVPLGGGLFFTTNHVITATMGAPTMVNVKCFNETFQRIGPASGVNVELDSRGDQSQQTPGTLGVTNDPLFTGLGWCWANNIASAQDFNVLTTIGSTTDLSPGGLLNSADSTLVAASTGLAEVSSVWGGIPYFDTSGGVPATYVFLVNPGTTARTIYLSLYDAAGTLRGTMVRAMSARDLDVLLVPDVFGLATPPVSGSVTIIDSGPANRGYLGWVIQVGDGKILFTAIGLDGNNRFLLAGADAP